MKQMTHVRGNRISMIFQQPTSCLNPVYNTAYQLSEVYRIHDKASKRLDARRLLICSNRSASPIRTPAEILPP